MQFDHSTHDSELPDVTDTDAVRTYLVKRLFSEGSIDDIEYGPSKEAIRASHATQKRERGRKELTALGTRVSTLLEFFADGEEVDPTSIKPALRLIRSETLEGDLFRLCTLLWSVPVSKGYGRRQRYVVMDEYNNKVIGIFALGDPVFNLRTRDQWIGWSVDQRRERLAHVMDAYVVGAMPPYNQLLGGKLIGSLIGSDEVREGFADKYRGKLGVISGKEKPSELALVTVTSALGRSSLYNRLRLDGMPSFLPIGYTGGWGHFQVDDETFRVIRDYLAHTGHAYANGHGFGKGPNWKLRTIRQALSQLGIDPGVLKHGIQRQVFAMPLTRDVPGYLCGESGYQPITRSLDEIAQAALTRWVVPRARRRPEYATWCKDAMKGELYSSVSQLAIDLTFKGER